MKKKHNDLFKLLQTDVDLQSVECKKVIDQLRSYKYQIDHQGSHADLKLYKKMIKKILLLQQTTKNQSLVKALRSMQGEYHQLYNKNRNIQLAEFYDMFDYDRTYMFYYD